MNDTNYFSGLVKVLEKPRKKTFKKAGEAIVLRVQFPQRRGTDILLNLVFWGNLGQDVKKYYKTNDYIIVEGYLSLRTDDLTTYFGQSSKINELELTVLKIYPFMLNSRQPTTKE